MRKPDDIERLYLDFDGFFASVEQQADPRLRDRPVGVVPFAGTDRTAVIACSKEAKAAGVKNVMPIREAKQVCPDLILVPQKPDLYRRAHNALLCEIETVIAIDTAKSIDELTCVLDESGQRDPELLAARIKAAIATNIGTCITSSIGFAANRQLAKIACKQRKEESRRLGSYGNGLAIWRPSDMPAPLLRVELKDIPGVGANMVGRLARNRVFTTAELYPRGVTIFRVGVTLYDLSPADERQIDMLDNDDTIRRKWEKVNSAVDTLNTRYSGTIISLGEWKPPAGGHAGGKISYTRIPSAEDFW